MQLRRSSLLQFSDAVRNLTWDIHQNSFGFFHLYTCSIGIFLILIFWFLLSFQNLKLDLIRLMMKCFWWTQLDILFLVFMFNSSQITLSFFFPQSCSTAFSWASSYQPYELYQPSNNDDAHDASSSWAPLSLYLTRPMHQYSDHVIQSRCPCYFPYDLYSHYGTHQINLVLEYSEYGDLLNWPIVPKLVYAHLHSLEKIRNWYWVHLCRCRFRYRWLPVKCNR